MRLSDVVITFAAVAFVAGCTPTTASKSVNYADYIDWDKEERIAQQIENQLVFAEPVWLETADQKRVFGIKSPSQSDPPAGTVILIHGTGAHANWSQVIEPLRIALSENGWGTLSVQMPYIANDIPPNAAPALFDHTNARIAAAVQYAKANMASPIYLVSHSRGGQQAAVYAAHAESPGVEGLVMIGTAAHYKQYPRQFDPANVLGDVSVPILDIYGEKDKHRIISSATERERASASDRYQRVQVPGAGHMWTGKEEQLGSRILEWLGG